MDGRSTGERQSGEREETRGEWVDGFLVVRASSSPPRSRAFASSRSKDARNTIDAPNAMIAHTSRPIVSHRSRRLSARARPREADAGRVGRERGNEDARDCGDARTTARRRACLLYTSDAADE